MKFVLSYTVRGGGDVEDRIEGAAMAQKLLATWTPSEAATMHQWLQRCDANGGFAVLETEDSAALYKDLATWNPWLEFQVYPVLDIGEASPLTEEAIGIAQSAEG